MLMNKVPDFNPIKHLYHQIYENSKINEYQEMVFLNVMFENHLNHFLSNIVLKSSTLRILSAEAFQLIDNETTENSHITRDFVKVYNQQNAQLIDPDEKIENNN